MGRPGDSGIIPLPVCVLYHIIILDVLLFLHGLFGVTRTRGYVFPASQTSLDILPVLSPSPGGRAGCAGSSAGRRGGVRAWSRAARPHRSPAAACHPR